ncbi:hypothetical protein [Streptomyces sp. NPDC059003]|uniref:hypothetical protein n=1 Tax=Streptomyces sp. NPDC059003 TaxID=3346691 RepID=UPI0036A1A5EA
MFTHARAAVLLASAMDVAYDGDDEMAITVHNANGSLFTAVGRTDTLQRVAAATEKNPLDFDPKDLQALLEYLSRLLTTPKPKGALAVCVPDVDRGGHLLWVWNLATFAPLRDTEAEQEFPGSDIPSSSRVYGCITDQGAPAPAMPITDRVIMTLVPHHHI